MQYTCTVCMHVGVVFVAIYPIHLVPSNSKWALSPEGHSKQLELFTQPDNTVQVIIHLTSTCM